MTNEEKIDKALDELARYIWEHEAENQIPDMNVARAYDILAEE